MVERRFFPEKKIKTIKEAFEEPAISQLRTYINMNLWLKKWKMTEIQNKFEVSYPYAMTNFSQIFLTFDKEPEKLILKSIIIAAGEDKADTYHKIRGFYTEVYLLTQLRGLDNLMSITGICEDKMLGFIQPKARWTLKKAISKQKLNEEENFQVLVGIANGMETLHGFGQKIIHGDLKPDNILLDVNKIPFINDYGQSYVVQQTGIYTKIQSTVQYMPPESFFNEDYTVKGDVWSFGCILNEMFGKQMLWSEIKTSDIKKLLAKGQIPALSAAVPESLKDLARSCLKIDPAERPSFSQIKQLLLGIKQDRSVAESLEKLNLEPPQIQKVEEEVKKEIKEELQKGCQIKYD